MTTLAIASAGNSVGHHWPFWMKRYVLDDRQAPVRRRRLDADPRNDSVAIVNTA